MTPTTPSPERADVFAGRLRAVRAALGFSLTQIATHLNVSRRGYINYENGSVFPQADFLLDLCSELCRVNPCWLLLGEKPVLLSEKNLPQPVVSISGNTACNLIAVADARAEITLGQGLGSELSLLRDLLGVTQEEMARSLGLSLRGYQNYERGERRLPAAVILQLATVYSRALNKPHDRLLLVRKRMGKSQAEMAGLLHLSTTGYQNYERGERDIPVVTLERAQAEHRISVAWVLDGEGKMFVTDGQAAP